MPVSIKISFRTALDAVPVNATIGGVLPVDDLQNFLKFLHPI